MRYIDRSKLLTELDVCADNKDEKTVNDSEVRKFLKREFDNKCWYTEVIPSGSLLEIDHFRPKGKIKPLKNSEYEYDFDYNWEYKDKGYYWLKDDVSNYRVSCRISNSKKSCYFPLGKGSPHLSPFGNEKEVAALLDPCSEEDVSLLHFRLDGEVESVSEDVYTKARVDASIDLYGLNDDVSLKSKRQKMLQALREEIDRYLSYRKKIIKCEERLQNVKCLGKDLELNSDLKEASWNLENEIANDLDEYNKQMEEQRLHIYDYVAKNHEFSACAISVIRSFSEEIPEIIESLDERGELKL